MGYIQAYIYGGPFCIHMCITKSYLLGLDYVLHISMSCPTETDREFTENPPRALWSIKCKIFIAVQLESVVLEYTYASAGGLVFIFHGHPIIEDNKSVRLAFTPPATSLVSSTNMMTTLLSVAIPLTQSRALAARRTHRQHQNTPVKLAVR